MIFLFVRHGEAEDDVLDAYGGWADHELTSKGHSQIKSTADKIKKLGVKFDKVLSSPLNRALQSAGIIANVLSLPLETYEYIKERNSYGILSGMIKAEAKEQYPDQVKKYDNNEWVDASEREKDFVYRVEKAFQLIKKRKETNLIVVTHGNFIKYFIKNIFGKDLIKKEDGGMFMIEVKNDKLIELLQDGIEF